MNNEEAILFLFSIAQEIKRAFDTPVILLTMKDYAECIFTSLVEMRTALLHRAAPERVVSIISDFHLTWLQAVQDIEWFKRQIKDTPRDSIITKAVDFTIDCAVKRKEYFQQYIESLKNTMTLQEHDLIGIDLKTITDMNINLESALHEKQKTIRNMVDPKEYFYKVLDETEELMIWLDVLNDNLAIQFSKFVGVRFPTALATDLSKTLQRLIEEVAGSSNQEMNKLVNDMQLKSESVSSKIRLGAGDKLEIRQIVEKIKDLENRIELLKRENSSAVAALQHKALFLEQRLDMMKDLKLSLSTLKSKKNDMLPKFKEDTHIFDHLLPKQDRQRLVEGLIKLWSDAVVGGLEGKSIISILSVADMKETFYDDLGKFVIDKYGRKLYTSYNEEFSLYQVNEKNHLVPVSDDDKHIYFYDDCGRYYIDDIKNRVYKAHKDASEYILDYDGVLIKTKEIRNGIVYYYDRLGRYYVEETGRQIYLGDDGEKYEDDGLGNLVKISSQIYYECSRPLIAIEETKYLQQTVGVALKKCIAEVVLHQPEDPILFLAQCLENYRHHEQERQSRREDEVGLMAERRERMRDLESLPTFPCPEGESDGVDYNFITYNTSFF